ncbi:uncharacterized protein LOC109538702 isoform X1 [Dendroctonus ponderosae]|uniref:uncharacterized protein LOC109538702 isoform X1 n=1 Tax=Dendroctonus ponderosae TaxID=77166 RepID=UPI0020363E3F|nr:uncharacterized protein LOC109538702 isoform X1 [Dendroctonus ponderosae]
MWRLVRVLLAGSCLLRLGDASAIQNLIGEPDYREVHLHWEAKNPDLPKNGFNVRYCELQSWGQQRCRLLSVNGTGGEKNFVEVAENEPIRQYSANVKGLRMATTYSFEVKQMKDKEEKEREDRAEGDDRNQNMIVIPTKGFSAKATQCLPDASEIEVSTGPFFGGRIAVEAADGERCAIDGEPTSPKDTYTLRINHTECGSQVNETTVATFVLVQENLPILTHSTRRFLVLCSYQPETLTVRAGISLPNSRGQAHLELASPVEDEDNYLGRRARKMRAGRLLHKPLALVQEEVAAAEAQISPKSQIVPVFVITMLSIAGVIGLVAIVLKISSKKLMEEMDNVSIASDLSTASTSSVVSIEESGDEKQEK